MADVFISYSRKNSEFARRLIDNLNRANKDSWVDWEGIPLTSPNWWAEIKAGIEGADNFIFIMSPDSMASVVCNMELDYAIELKKRIVPVVCRDISSRDAFASIADFEPDEAMTERLAGKDPLMVARDNWQRLSHINWLFFRETDEFNTGFETLISTVETDVEYVKAHTRYINRAQEWQREHLRSDLLLFGEEIRRAEQWLVKAEGYTAQAKTNTQKKIDIVNPLPQALHYNYIKESRKAEQRRQRLVRSTQISIAVLILVLIIGGVISSLLVTNTQQEVILAQSQLTDIPPTLNSISTDIQIAQNYADSIQLAAIAQDTYNNGYQPLGVSLALQASYIDELPQTERILGELAYQPGVRRIFEGHRGDYVTSAAFSPDGLKIVSGSCVSNDYPCSQGELILWDALTGQISGSSVGDFGRISTVVFSPDGDTILTGSVIGELILWDASTLTELKRFKGHTNAVTSVAFSPDRQFMASSACKTSDFVCPEGEIFLWDTSNGSRLRVFEGHSKGATSIAFSPDGQSFVTGSWDTTVILWDTASGNIRHVFEGNYGGISSVAFSPDGTTFVAGSWGGHLFLWDVTSGTLIRRLQGAFSISDVVFSPDGLTVISSSCIADEEFCPAGVLMLWEVQTGNLLHRFQYNSSITDIDFNPDGKTVISAAANGMVVLWDVLDGSIVQKITTPSTITHLVYAPDNQTLLYVSSGRVNIWNIETNEIQAFEEHKQWITDIAISPDGKLVASASCTENSSPCPLEEILIWDINSRNILRRFRGHTDDIFNMVFSLDGSSVFSADSRKVVRWDIATGEKQLVVPEVPGFIEALNPTGQTLLYSDDQNNLILWDIATNKSLGKFEGHSELITAAVFSPDGKTILSGSQDNTVILWDVATATLIHRFEGHLAEITEIAFSPDGQTFISGSYDGSIILWDITTKKSLHRYKGHPDSVRSLVFSPDGTTFVSGAAFGTMIIWRNDGLEQLQAWTIANRYLPELTCSQRASYNIPGECINETPPASPTSIPTRTPYPIPMIPEWTAFAPLTETAIP